MPVISRIELRGIEKGRQEGMQAGMQKGMEKGMQEGRQEGRQEGLKLGEAREKKKMLKIAKWMRETGSDRATIRRLTALSDAELDELFEEHLIVQ